MRVYVLSTINYFRGDIATLCVLRGTFACKGREGVLCCVSVYCIVGMYMEEDVLYEWEYIRFGV